MSSLPLHPFVVHFPIVLAVLVPIVAFGAAFFLFKEKGWKRVWMIPVSLQVAVLILSFVAVQLGEADEERVEAVVAEQVLEEHEEWGERFLVFSGGLTLLMLLPLFLKTRFLPLLVATISLVGTGLVLKVGHSGGELVYNHGAAAVYSNMDKANPARGFRGHDDDDDDD